MRDEAEERMEDRMERLDAVAIMARGAVRRAAALGLRYVWVGEDWWGDLCVSPTTRPPNPLRNPAHAVPAPRAGPPDLEKRELDRWAIKVLWVMLDVGLLGNITEEDFTRAFLYRENEN
jgi:hypothetical protein